MDKKEFLKLSYELDKCGKFVEADSLTDKLIKISQQKKIYMPYVPRTNGYIDIDQQIYDRGLYRGISPFRGQMSGLQLWMGGGFRREAYIQGAYQEAYSFHDLIYHWPSERHLENADKSSTWADKNLNKKQEFAKYMSTAIDALKQIAKNQGVEINLDARDKGIENFYQNRQHTSRDIFLEFSRWVEGQFRIFSKEGTYYPYLVQLRYAETALASEVDPGIKTPMQQIKAGTPVGGPLRIETAKPGSGSKDTGAVGANSPGSNDKPQTGKPAAGPMSRQKIDNPAKPINSGDSVL